MKCVLLSILLTKMTEATHNRKYYRYPRSRFGEHNVQKNQKDMDGYWVVELRDVGLVLA